MIKYLELTAPEKSEFRQVKIVSIEVSEGDEVALGDTLFKVKNGKNEIDLPSTMGGKVVEIIAMIGENISVMTPLILLETEVEGSTATAPINIDDSSMQEPSANQDPSANKEPSADKEPSANQEPAASKNDTQKEKPVKDKKKKAKKKAKKKTKKKHQQQSLNLDPDSNDNDDAIDEDSFTPSTKTEPDTTPVLPETKTMSNIKVTVPDIGADNAKVIELFVAVGDQIEVDDPLITLESDKASMDVPSTHAGTITAISVEIDQDVGEGDLIIELSSDSDSSAEQENTQDESKEQVQTNNSTDVAASSEVIDVAIPDIGGDSAKVIEILVEVGQVIAAEEALVTLESDKASMDVPSTVAGKIESIEVSIDQDVSEGVVVVKVSTDSPSSSNDTAPDVATPTETAASTTSSIVDVTVPDIGGDSAKVIEIHVETGQQVAVEDPLVTLESDKASMDVPSTVAGTIESIEIKIDQDVSEGTLVVTVASSAAAKSTSDTPVVTNEPEKPKPVSESKAAEAKTLAPATGKAHASPSIRRFARELGVDLAKVGGSGRKGRIVKSDVKAFVKNVMLGGASAQAGGATDSGIPPIPAVDFTKFGEIDIQPLNKIKKLTAKNLHRSWVNVPHVTHNDESNINDLEDFRKQLNKEYAAQDKGIKLSPLAFIVKAVVHALRHYPQFNSSLEPGGENLIYKKYIHIGIAVETPNGLVVPVIRDADKLSISEIATAMGDLAKKARDKKLSPADMSGGCFTISSLGGIGGTSFTPIVNAPEVAILGVSRSKIQPVWDGEKFEPAMILPLSLSYDHRIIDGAEAARFTAHIAAALEDVRRLTV